MIAAATAARTIHRSRGAAPMALAAADPPARQQYHGWSRRPPRTVVRLLFIGSLGLASSTAAADSIGCEGGIVSVGDSRLDLFAKCGPPTLQEAEPVITTGYVDLSLSIERWTYKLLDEVSIQRAGGRALRGSSRDGHCRRR